MIYTPRDISWGRVQFVLSLNREQENDLSMNLSWEKVVYTDKYRRKVTKHLHTFRKLFLALAMKDRVWCRLTRLFTVVVSLTILTVGDTVTWSVPDKDVEPPKSVWQSRICLNMSKGVIMYIYKTMKKKSCEILLVPQGFCFPLVTHTLTTNL